MKKRAMKKWIPNHPLYCYNAKTGDCKWYKDLNKDKNATLLREKYCTEKNWCIQFKENDNCIECLLFESDDGTKYPEPLTYCAYMNVFEVGQYPLGDMCKICGEHLKSKNDKYW